MASMAQESKLQIIFNVSLQLAFLWLGAIFGVYTVLSWYFAEIALDQAVLSNQLALATFCQGAVSLFRKK
jgi:hypothetical protein